MYDSCYHIHLFHPQMLRPLSITIPTNLYKYVCKYPQQEHGDSWNIDQHSSNSSLACFCGGKSYVCHRWLLLDSVDSLSNLKLNNHIQRYYSTRYPLSSSSPATDTSWGIMWCCQFSNAPFVASMSGLCSSTSAQRYTSGTMKTLLYASCPNPQCLLFTTITYNVYPPPFILGMYLFPTGTGFSNIWYVSSSHLFFGNQFLTDTLDGLFEELPSGVLQFFCLDTC